MPSNPIPTVRASHHGVDAENPWPGLVAFTEDSRDYFHGRDDEADELLRRVGRKNLTILFGQSGLGKSSLLQAGLFPLLRTEGYLPIPIRLDHAASSPPLSLQVSAATTRAILAAGGQVEGLESGEGRSLWEHFHRRGLRLETEDGRPIFPVLVFDQFEELFAIGQASDATQARASSFLAEMADLVEDRAPETLEVRLGAEPELARLYTFEDRHCRVLICLREDYLAHLEGLRELMPSISENRMRLTRMNGTRALEAVTVPGAKILSRSIGAQIVRFVAGGRLLSSYGEPARGEDDELAGLEIEPSLLSLVCRELNNRRVERGLQSVTADLVAGNRERILQDFYENCLAGQPPAVRTFVEDEMVTDSGLRENIALERAVKTLALRGAPAPASAIDDLVRHRLLHLEDRLEIRRVELTHDVLTSVVKKSRDERLGREALLRAEQESRKNEERSRLQRRKLQVMVAGMAAALILVSGFTIWSRQLLQANRRANDELSQSVAKGLTSESDALRRAGVFGDARSGLIRSLDLLKDSDAWSLPTKLVLWNLYHDSPPELMSYPTGAVVVRCIAYSPDGSLGLSGDANGAVKLWDVARGIEISTLRGHDAAVQCVSFSRDGLRAITGDAKNTVRLWDLAGNQRVRSASKAFIGQSGKIISVSLSADGRRALSAGDDNSVMLWDLETGAGLSLSGGDSGSSALVNDLATGMSNVGFLRGDNDVLFARRGRGRNDHALISWDLRGGEPRKLLSSHQNFVAGIAIAPDGRTAVSGGVDGTFKVWDLVGGKESRSFPPKPANITRVAFSPDCRFALTVDGNTPSESGSDSSLTLWDLGSGEILRTNSTYIGQVTAIALAPDNRSALVAGSDRSMKLIDLGESQEVRTFRGHTAAVTSVAFSPDDRLAVSGSRDRRMMLWDLTTGKVLWSIAAHGEGGVTSVAFSPDGGSVLSGGWDSEMRRWGVDGKLRKQFVAADHDEVTGVVYAPNGGSAFSSSEDRTLRQWDLDGEPRQTLIKSSDQSSGLRGLAISKDGRSLLSCSTDKSIKFCEDLAAHRPLRTYSEHEGPVNSVTFAPDGLMGLSASDDRTLKLWDLRKGRVVKTLAGQTGHRNAVTSVSFASDGRTALSGSRDLTLKLWRIDNGTVLRTMRGHTKGVASVALSHDGPDALSGGRDSTMRWWRIGRVDRYLEFAQVVERAQDVLSRDSTDASSLASLGEWYAFRGVDTWAVALLEEARSKGAPISSLTLARSYWRLHDPKDQASRTYRDRAYREFSRALELKEAPESYLTICCEATRDRPSTPAGEAGPRVAAAPAAPPQTPEGHADPGLSRYVRPAKPVKGTLLIGGGGTARRFVEPLVRAFKEIHPDVTSELTLRGTLTAPRGLGDEEYNLGIMSRPMTPEEMARIWKETEHDVVEVAIALDALRVLVNKDNPVQGITLPQLDALYGTQRLAGYNRPIATWGDLGVTGDFASVRITPYGILEENNGTVETFRRIALRNGPLNKSIGNISFPDKEFGDAVARDRGGISYNIDHQPVPGARTIGVAARSEGPFVLPSPETVGSGSYPLTRSIYAYYCDATEQAVVEFLRFALSREGQDIVATHSATPLSPQLANEFRDKLPN